MPWPKAENSTAARPKRARPSTGSGTADEIAQAVLWLSSDGASYVTGIALPVDGGYTAQ